MKYELVKTLEPHPVIKPGESVFIEFKLGWDERCFDRLTPVDCNQHAPVFLHQNVGQYYTRQPLFEVGDEFKFSDMSLRVTRVELNLVVFEQSLPGGKILQQKFTYENAREYYKSVCNAYSK
jgi:hypothetical protein